jgi:hypothetical protein
MKNVMEEEPTFKMRNRLSNAPGVLPKAETTERRPTSLEVASIRSRSTSAVLSDPGSAAASVAGRERRFRSFPGSFWKACWAARQPFKPSAMVDAPLLYSRGVKLFESGLAGGRDDVISVFGFSLTVCSPREQSFLFRVLAESGG